MNNFHKNPVVSVVMSVYNCGKYLSQAIESILSQSFSNFEFLIIDDGSSDETPCILSAYEKKDMRIKIFTQKNQGLTNALNTLIDMSSGEFIARMDADDICLPERLSEQVKYMKANSGCGLVGTGKYSIASNGMILDGICLPNNHDFLKKWLEKGINVFTHGSVMIRKSYLELLDCQYRFKYGQDFDLFLRLSDIAKLGMVEKPLYKFRISGESLSANLQSFRGQQKALQLKLYDERKNGGEQSDWRQEEDKILRMQNNNKTDSRAVEAHAIGKALFKQGNVKASVPYFIKAIRNTYLRKSSVKYLLISIFPSKYALKIQNIVSRKMDHWGEYRINLSGDLSGEE